MKTCCVCREAKTFDQFHKERRGKHGLQARCKPCHRQYQVNRLKDPANRERLKRSFLLWSLKSLYGISEDEYEGLALAQAGQCAICGGGNGTKRLAVDHCHKTGVVRGLLCDQCNHGLGCFGDDPGALLNAAHYLGNCHEGG